MAWHVTGKLLSGLVVGVAVGATVAVVFSSRTAVALPRTEETLSGPTPFQPANSLIAKARTLADEVRTQVRQAIDEGRATAARTREDLTARFEAAKQGPNSDKA